MGKNWIYDSIVGSDEPTPARPVPSIPTLDTREILWSSGKRTTGLQRALDQCARKAAVTAIFGEAGHEMLENSQLAEPSTSTYAQPRLPEPTQLRTLPPRCGCDCRACQAGGCFACSETPRCEFSALDVLSEITPVSAEEEAKFRQAAHVRQKQRIASKRTEQPFKVERKGNLRKSFFSWGEAWEIVLV